MKSLFLAGALATGLAGAVSAQGIEVMDAYARVSSAAAKSGAIFMVISNGGGSDDRLVAAEAPVAQRAELHTHLEDANGVMRMVEVEDGIALPAGQDHALARGGDHVMLMGLKEPLVDGSHFPLTLTFEEAGPITVDVVVDSARAPDQPAGQDMQHGAMHGMGAVN
ncbi:MAG: copper chaperone PCu(A)C [Rhodobacteraceae bacterium]|nr:copper chaperone PCu(A)C [Paracoccaceae bacterium]